ncbi:MAG: TauD/TfdA family dioxygenase, partial [Alphaproteobacteria bacterium]|nr:TauD/TfdA family dioxygenase [Alphaproteobacteria bacterium]
AQHLWRSAAAAHGLTVTDAGPCTGTEIAGLDLTKPLDATLRAILRAAVVERIVLVFRGQAGLDAAGYLALARQFGDTCDLHSQRQFCHRDFHEIFVVGNVAEYGRAAGAPKVGLNWHTDHYHLERPGLFTFLHAIDVPPISGETRYANAIAAYDALPESTRARIDGLQVLHSRARMFVHAFPDATIEQIENERRLAPDVIHPLVRFHPDLGRRGLYLGGEWGSYILGLEEREADVLFKELLAHVIQERFVYTHHWRPGDVVMADNRCSVHRATEWDETRYKRRLHRIILLDDERPRSAAA